MVTVVEGSAKAESRGEAGLLNTADAASQLGVSPSRVLALIHSRRLPATKIGRDWLIRIADLEMVRERRVGRPRQRDGAARAGGREARMAIGRTSGVAETVDPSTTRRVGIQPMYTMAIGSQKGGVAKTTSTIYLAARAAVHFGSTPERPLVAVLDRDEAHNLSALADLRPDIVAPGVRLLSGADLPPASAGYRMVLIDTPPGLSAIDSLREADLLVVPVLPEEQGVANLVRYLRLIEGQRRTTSPRLRLLALLPTMVESRNALHRDMLAQIERIAARHITPLRVLTPVSRSNRVARCELNAPGYNGAAKELFDALR